MARNSFIQISKLGNLKGRIDYITNPKGRKICTQFTIQQTIHFGMNLQGVIDWNLRKAEVPESVSNQEN